MLCRLSELTIASSDLSLFLPTPFPHTALFFLFLLMLAASCCPMFVVRIFSRFGYIFLLTTTPPRFVVIGMKQGSLKQAAMISVWLLEFQILCLQATYCVSCLLLDLVVKVTLALLAGALLYVIFRALILLAPFRPFYALIHDYIHYSLTRGRRMWAHGSS
jgi:hypothetical protein